MNFSDVFEFQNKSGIKAGEGLEQGRYFFYTSSDVQTKFLNEYLFDGDALIFGTGGNASVHFTDQKFAVSTDCLVAQPMDKRNVYAKFYYYFLRGNMRILERGFRGAGLKHISKSYISAIELPKGDFDRQKTVVDILDQADALRQKRQQSLQLLDDFLRVSFLEMFGNPQTNHKDLRCGTIRDLVTDVKYGSSKKAGALGAYPMLRMNNITYRGAWNFTDMKYTDLADDEIVKYTVRKGDILFNRTNSKELVGKTAVYRGDQSMAFAGYLIRVRVNDKANPEYIAGFLNSEYGKTYLMSTCKSIVGMANINAQELQDIPILLPPAEEQQEYATLVQAALKTRELMLKSALELDNQFSALTQRYFG